MEHDAVPQDNSRVLAGYRKAVYARDAAGRIQVVASTGWEVEDIVTTQAADALRAQAEQARLAALAGTGSPLSYWMYQRRMDVPLLAQSTGLWQWRVRRHLQPARFARLGEPLLARYARALGLTLEQVRHCPDTPDTPGAPIDTHHHGL